jgi:hypothetical protein
MSLALDPTLRELDDCHCCAAPGGLPPAAANRPGLAAVAYRFGTHPQLKADLLARLSAREFPALSRLHTRDDDDPIVALLDAWATAGDIFGFYQERIANESYLRTAREDRSLYELARLIGYQPGAGVAAGTWLAFTMEAADGAPDASAIAAGTRVQSIPGPGQRPQVFETVEAITARPDWNALCPRIARPQPLSGDLAEVLVAALDARLQPGVGVLILPGDGDFRLKRIREATADRAAGTTRIGLAAVVPEPSPPVFASPAPGPFAIQPRVLTGREVRERILGRSWKAADLVAQSRVQRWPLKAVTGNLKAQLARRERPAGSGVYLLDRQAAVFGHNAPAWDSLPAAQRYGVNATPENGLPANVSASYPASSDWDTHPPTLAAQAGGGPYLHLDRVYEGLAAGGLVLLESPSRTPYLYRIEEVAEISRTGFTLAAKVTRLKLDSWAGLHLFRVRDTRVHLAERSPLALADLPIVEPVPAAAAPDRLALDGPELNLREGQRLILGGEDADLEGVSACELVTLADVTLVDGLTQLTFTRPLERRYRRATVRLNANVAPATHGETREEAIGSGDGTAGFQRFRLHQPPLTQVPDEGPSGARPALEVRVDGLLWERVGSLVDSGPGDRVYVLRTDSAGESEVQFGDGRNGARLPTGLENVRARYRQGMGEEAMVAAGSLSLPLTRPLGVRQVTNPLAASGAEDRETGERIRQTAALGIMTLDRVVSVRDYGDFARAFAGVAKALAVCFWDGRRRGVHLTLAGAGGTALPADGATRQNLRAAIVQAGDPRVPLWIDSYRPAFFRVGARIGIDPAYARDAVLAAVEAGLRARFGFAGRNFAQGVVRSEAIAAIQEIPGVLAVDLDRFQRTDAGPYAPPVPGALEAAAARSTEGGILAAELLLLDPRPLDLGVMP